MKVQRSAAQRVRQVVEHACCVKHLVEAEQIVRNDRLDVLRAAFDHLKIAASPESVLIAITADA